MENKTSVRPWQWWSLAALVVLAGIYWERMTSSASYRRALDAAGDIALPGVNCDSIEVRKLAQKMPQDARDAYVAFLGYDSGFVFLLLAVFLIVAVLLYRERLHLRAYGLGAAAIVYAICDWTENGLATKLFQSAGAAGVEGLYWATLFKWAALVVAIVLALPGVARLRGSGHSWWLALFRDVPYIIDSLWRRGEFVANREHVYRETPDGTAWGFDKRAWWSKPPVGYIGITLLFVTLGPTLDALCSLVPVPGAFAYAGLVALGPAVGYVLFRVYRSIHGPVDHRFNDPSDHDETLARSKEALAERARVTKTILWTAAALLIGAAVAPTITMLVTAAKAGACGTAQFSQWTLLALLACVVAVFVYASAVRTRAPTSKVIGLQAVLFAAVCAAVFTTASDLEALAVPYRHVFGFLAPALVVSLALAPVMAWLFLQPTERGDSPCHIDGITQPTRAFFAQRLAKTELFLRPEYPPEPHGSHVAYAVIRAATYRGLFLLLLPSMLAFFAPADWLDACWGFGLAASVLLGTWGSMSRRWEQMNRHLDRWFLSGTALFVSIFVIVIGTLRFAGIDYVTTILDAAPFGVLFASVVMSYVLSWLVEYWINRMVAVELLAVLGGNRADTAMPYRLEDDVTALGYVRREGRILAYHGLGRFLVTGRLTNDDRVPRYVAEAKTAWHSYDLLELFTVLAGSHRNQLGQVVRASNLYFYAMNAVLLVVFAGFGLAYWSMRQETPVEVVTTPAGENPGELKALDLRATAGNNRPAVVVIGSGGGTRAALYTSHVLQGLNQIGVGRDIVLLSGVSGGGVALAYFAAHYGELTDTSSSKAITWNAFRETVAKNLIGDVLEGAQEWRIFGRSPLSALLAESMERNMLAPPQPGSAPKRSPLPAPTMALPGAPPLILNTTITGHPAEDSEVLRNTLTPAEDADCRNASRPYNMMSGGRLVFTNLKDTDSFPATRVDAKPPDKLTVSASQKPPIPNTRLPYWIVKDPEVKLAQAATLNANFPPVFPNARVSITHYVEDAKVKCRERSYFVTDGGAQENLGLVSALYAVQGALRQYQKYQKKCAEKKDKCAPLRPLHFVIAEASGAGYDYSQDRGLSAAFGSAKDRLTGGLTNALIDETVAIYRELGVSDAPVRFHYLPLPLAFRARGGFGTHWMHAESFDLSDPRSREPSRGRLFSATLKRKEIDQMWLALHDKSGDYCAVTMPDGSIQTDKVKRWICGSPLEGKTPARDLHVDAWKSLVGVLGPQLPR